MKGMSHIILRAVGPLMLLNSLAFSSISFAQSAGRVMPGDCAYEAVLPEQVEADRVLIRPGEFHRLPDPQLNGPRPPNVRYHVVPVFGDIHGNMEGLLSTVRRLQRAHDVKYPFVLQVGDLGYYPDAGSFQKVNKASRQSPTEMGVHTFITNPALYEKYYLKAQGCDQLDCKIIFVRGNHDDPVVREKDQNSPSGLVQVDPYGTLHYLKDGSVAELQFNRDNRAGMVIGGFGGIGRDSRPKAQEKTPGILFDREAEGKILEWNEITPIDVLVTHQGTTLVRDGHQDIDGLVSVIEPKLHVHGHSHVAQGPMMMGQTPSYSINKMPAEKNPEVGNFVGMLRYYENGDIEFVPAREPRRRPAQP